MPFNTVYEFTAYEVLTAANLNNNDSNLDYLKSKADRRVGVLPVISPTVDLATGDGQGYFTIPADVDGMDLVDCEICVYTASSSGVITVMLHNLTDTVDMLTTAITCDANELSSHTAATPKVIDTDNDDVSEGDQIRVDVDGVGTGSKGLDVHFAFLLQ